MISDPDIVAAVRAGERDAVLAALVPRYRRQVYSLAWSIVKDSAAAEDIAQDVFVRVWRALPTYDGRARFSTWLYAITRNAAISAQRRARPLLSLSDAATFAEAEAATGEEAAAPGAAADARAVAEAIAELPERQQQVVTLFYMQDRSYEEVADMLAMPLGTVKTLLHRARARLEQRLGDAGPGDSR